MLSKICLGAKFSFPEAKVSLPEAKASFPEAKVSFPEAKVSFPEAEVSFPEAEFSFASGGFPDARFSSRGLRGSSKHAQCNMYVSCQGETYDFISCEFKILLRVSHVTRIVFDAAWICPVVAWMFFDVA